MKRVSIDYRYDECGLDNVILKDLTVLKDDDGEDVITIPNIRLLHSVLMMEIATKDSGMQPAELRFVRTEFGLTQAELAALVGRDVQAIGRWERGEHPMDKAAEIVIRAKVLETTGQMLKMEELARRTMASASQPPFLIDASNPNQYKPIHNIAA
jgi:DNA-binding transcriptional regulator YiaG